MLFHGIHLATDRQTNKTTHSSPSAENANFERIFGKYSYGRGDPKTYDIEKEKVFTLFKEGGKQIPVRVKVYPYRNGSKVVYDYSVNYALLGNGSSTLDYEFIKVLNQKIEKAAKD